jgi:hypothetical protein
MPDPIDQAYVEAEAVLSDEAARAARRGRVLAAVARQDASGPAASAARPRLWRRGGWLVAASVSGLVLAITLQLDRPGPYPPPTKPTAAPAVPAGAARGTAAAPESPAPASPAPASPAPASPTPPRASALAAKPAPPPARSEAEPAPVIVASSPAPPPARSSVVSAPRAFPSDETGPPPPPPADAASSERAAPVQAENQPSGAENVTEMVVTAEKREARRKSVPAAISAFTGRVRDVIDPGGRLRAAAAAGRATDVEALLEQGAPVDAADAAGNTALMKSIQADQPDAAAVLSQHGASLDRKNHAGESARDMARAKGDAELDQAIGLSP